MLGRNDNKLLERAYHKVFDKKYCGMYSPNAVDIGSHYVFFPRPFGMDANEAYYTGKLMPCFNKATGKVKAIDITKVNLRAGKTIQLNIHISQEV